MISPDPEIFFKSQNESQSDHLETDIDDVMSHTEIDPSHTVTFDQQVDQNENSTSQGHERSHISNPHQRSHTTTFDHEHERSHISSPQKRSHTVTFHQGHERSHISGPQQRSHTEMFAQGHERSHITGPQQRSHNERSHISSHQQRSHSDNQFEDHDFCRPQNRTSTPENNTDSSNNNQNRQRNPLDLALRSYNFTNQCPPAPQVPAHMIKPDIFDGSQSFEQYASHFEDCSELSRWDNRTKVLVLSASLRGPARNFYMSLPDIERRDYFHLTARLTERFGSSRHQSLWLSKLENRHRSKVESIASLGDDLRQLAQKAYYDLDTRAQERLALIQLYKLIDVNMKCRCIDHHCETVNEAVSVIEKYESILGTQPFSNIRVLEAKQNEPNTIASLSTSMKRIEERLGKIERSRNPYPSTPAAENNVRVCFGCNSPKHFWRQCPHNNEQHRLRPSRYEYGTNMYNSQATPAHDTFNRQSRPQPNRQPYNTSSHVSEN